jgi:hypothetical protein
MGFLLPGKVFPLDLDIFSSSLFFGAGSLSVEDKDAVCLKEQLYSQNCASVLYKEVEHAGLTSSYNCSHLAYQDEHGTGKNNWDKLP